MAPAPDQITEKRARGWRSVLARVAVVALILLLCLVAIGWTQRTDIARDLIGDQLAQLGVEATYVVADIDTEKQVLTNIVVGDPARPDLTIERAEVRLVYGFGVPEIGKIIVDKPRLYGNTRNGTLSFGALDPAIFSENNDEPASLPAFDIVINDGRARIDTDFGPLGIKLQGEGQLDDGFAGYFAAVAPNLSLAKCGVTGASAFGDLETSAGAISVSGPLRVGAVGCDEIGLAVSGLAWQTKIAIESDLETMRADGVVQTGRVNSLAGTAIGGRGPLKLALRDGDIWSDFNIEFDQVSSAQVAARVLGIDGAVRSRAGFSQASIDASIEASGVSVNQALIGQLEEQSKASEGTLIAPLLRKFSTSIRRQLRGASLSGSVAGRIGPEEQTVTVPEALLRGSTGATIGSLTQGRYRQSGGETPRLSGNFRVAGQDLPQLAGRMERKSDGGSVFRLKMAEYAADASRIEIPEMLVSQARSGVVTFAGALIASGPLPGGSARELNIPVNGGWNRSAGLSLWERCAEISFDTLAFADLKLSGRSVRMCPPAGRPIVRMAGRTLSIVAGLPSLNVAGSVANTPIRIDSGPIGFAYPGIAKAQNVSVLLGEVGLESRFAVTEVIADLRAESGDIAGTFSGSEIALAAVPLNLTDAEGEWDFSEGVFAINNSKFTLNDRASPARFEPMQATSGTLRLTDNVIDANASVRAATNLAEISNVSMTHNLATGIGFADLSVNALRFDEGLQPTDLTPLALGVVANVEGTVSGSGRIDWSPETIRSFGAFSSEALDLAAAFGPVKGASGTIAFSDLLSLTTAPNQVISVASINPGIEAKDGKIGFNLRDGQFLGVSGGEWPFMGGKLFLRPVDLNLGIAERRRYVLEVEDVDAALFVDNLEIGNLAATGKFNGSLPIVFDEEGFGEIQGGVLTSKPPGGNVSYVGELTYEDLSPVANYAFQTLRSLDYDTMEIQMAGPLTGDIVTKVVFSGVKQGQGTSQNFITKQIADLPIQFNVNIRAPFYQLVTSLKSMYDPAAVRDPRDLGLLTDDGTRFVPPSGIAPATPPQSPPEQKIPNGAAIRPEESSDQSLAIQTLAIQTLDSEDMP